MKLQKARVNRNYFVNKRDKADENTIHLEGALWLDETRFSRVKKAFRLSDWLNKVVNWIFA